MVLHQLAPAGTPISLRDIAHWIISLPRARRNLDDFGEEFRRRFGIRHCYFVSSGRAAMFQVLQTLRATASERRTDVIVPSYTCYSVPASAIRAGLRVRVIDIDPDTLSYNLEQLERTNFDNVLAIVTANLYGMPNELPALAALAQRRGVYLLDDAAQSLGATIAGRAVGSFGDVGLYSFDKGKNVTSIQGGVIVTNADRLAPDLSARIAALPPATWKYTVSLVLQMFIYATFLPPSRYWIPARLPGVGLGTTRYEDDYPVTQYPSVLGAMAARLFQRLDQIQAHRIHIAGRYRERLAANPHVRLIQPVTGAQPVYPRFPLLLDSRERRDRALQVLTDAGLGASGSYPSALTDVPEIAAHLDVSGSHAETGRTIAARILTLPTHPYVTTAHVDRICSILSES